MARPVETFQIKAERHPRRCEVCHQDDLFDPFSGHCSRCSAIIPIFETPAPFREDDFGGLWLFGDILAMLISGAFGLIALGAFLLFGLLRVGDASLEEMIRLVGCMLFSMPGFALFYWYVQIYRERADMFQSRSVWFWTVVYNLLIIVMGVLKAFFLQGFMEIFSMNVMAFLLWPALMTVYGLFSMRRFRLPEIQPVGEAE